MPAKTLRHLNATLHRQQEYSIFSNTQILTGGHTLLNSAASDKLILEQF